MGSTWTPLCPSTGTKLGTHPYGYTSFEFDLTPDLNFSASNVLAVRVDNSAQPNSRWYSGYGIYLFRPGVISRTINLSNLLEEPCTDSPFFVSP